MYPRIRGRRDRTSSSRASPVAALSTCARSSQVRRYDLTWKNSMLGVHTWRLHPNVWGNHASAVTAGQVGKEKKAVFPSLSERPTLKPLPLAGAVP